uniref:Uncharacterized protein n=1 Tax=viral metagenome TaxID=1070528 RepID=A0A6C0L9I6_9ZZZZ
MSYAPGTVLSIGFGETLEQVVVLTENKIATCCYAGKPVGRRDIMSLDDWKILCTAQGQQIRSDAPVAAAAPSSSTSAPVYAVNTILRWKKDDDNRRTAMVVKDGILQLKEIMLGRRSANDKKFFSSFADWKSTLPSGGEIAVQVGTPTVESKISAPIVAKTDVEYINELKKRFRVQTAYVLEKSHNQNREEAISMLKQNGPPLAKMIADLGATPTEESISSILYYANQVLNAASLAYRSQVMIRYKPTEADLRKKKFQASGRQAIYAFFKGAKVEITSGNGQVAIARDSQGRIARWTTPTAASTFAELGIEMVNGKPRLEVEYRKKKISM